ncbi:transcriptional repressor [Roseivivax sp. GX 12232]|uniref:Fur family transcriptional regulator n=1 Tax=Roseivivax sp. GX 12232 TaxID=2900547 RepID=UPI001E49B819|nr:Fur family transcriptional regulator [Roseivivax sp. GX 12232]MCE0506549.1 transcriptional repressor [Roseivivax sp. GX 12232]
MLHGSAMASDFYSSEGDAILREAGLRVTRQRRAIVRVLFEAEDHPDAEQVLGRARDKDASVSQATAYRTLAALADKGHLHRHTFDGGVTRYELASRPHHDHMIDVETGEVMEFVSEEIERLQKKIAAEHGYDIVAHRLELYCKRRRR